MSRQLHLGFDLTNADSVRDFATRAPDALYLEDLGLLFAVALGQLGVLGHFCFVAADDGALAPLIGDDWTIAGRPAGADRLVLRSETPEGVALHFSLAVPIAPDRADRARIHALVEFYAAHLLPLVELDGDPAADLPMDRAERCRALAGTGWSCLDIGERFGLSAPAIRILLRRV